MPIYDYHCSNCKHVWEGLYSISGRKSPESEPCPSCNVVGKVEQTIVFSTLSVNCTSEATKALNKLNRGSKFKDKMQQIHDKTPGSMMHKTSKFIEIK